MRPTANSVAEIERFLESDSSRLGDVFRLQRQGLDAEAIASRLGVATSRFVWNQAWLLDFLLQGDMPTAPTVAKYCASKAGTLLKSGEWSAGVRHYLEEVRRLACVRSG